MHKLDELDYDGSGAAAAAGLPVGVHAMPAVAPAPPLQPLRIGRMTIDFPVILAPLAGFSDLPFRTICRSLSAPFAVTEAALDRYILGGGKLRRKFLTSNAGDHPTAAQIMGSDPDTMAGAAGVLAGSGFEAVDLNFACPVRKVTTHRRGGALMSDPDLALEIVRRVVRTVPGVPVTLKLRRSGREADTAHAAFWRIARGGFDAGIAAICVHARSVEAKYGGPADWDFLASVKREFPDRTIIGSGDVLSAAAALEMIRRTGVDGAACARGAIGNPWIFRQARDLAAGLDPAPPGIPEQRRVIAHHYELLRELYGPSLGLHTLRNLGIRYARVHPCRERVRSAFIGLRTDDELRRIMDEFYGDKAERDASPDEPASDGGLGAGSAI